MEIRLAGEPVLDSIVDGPGLRMTLFTQGCPHHCKGCHNPQTWNYGGGYIYDVEDIKKLIKENSSIYSGITFSGGEPMLWPEQLIEIAKYAKSFGWDVWSYTGFLYEELLYTPLCKELLEQLNVLVDGPFVLEQKSYDCKWRGSTNQRLINVQESLKNNKTVLYNED